MAPGARRRARATQPRRAFGDVHHRQRLRVHGVAGAALQRGLGPAAHHRVRARAGGVPRRGGARGVVGPPLGPHALRRRRRHWTLRLRHGRVRLRRRPVQRRRRRHARHAGRVHARRQRRPRLLRRQPRGRVQPAHGHHAHSLFLLLRQVRGHGVRRGAERRVPGGPAGGRRGGRAGGVPERLRRLRGRAVLLQRRLWEPRRVPALGILPVLQGRLPARLQLRLRRRHLHLHMRRRHHRLHRHLLPRRAHQREVDGAEPAGRRAAAAGEQRHHHGLLRRQRAAQQRRHRRRRHEPSRRRRCHHGRRPLVSTPLSAAAANAGRFRLVD